MRSVNLDNCDHIVMNNIKHINIATVFSGIGSPEQALERLRVPHDIVFACDNGDRVIEYDHEKEFQTIKSFSSAKEKKSMLIIYIRQKAVKQITCNSLTQQITQ